jgi:hypothetical protein
MTATVGDDLLAPRLEPSPGNCCVRLDDTRRAAKEQR